MNYIKKLDWLNATLVDFSSALTYVIEPQIEEDGHIFNLSENSRFLKKFILYRVCEYILKVLENSTGSKVIFVMPHDFKLKFLQQHEGAIKAYLMLVSKILSLNIFINKLSFNEIVDLTTTTTGDGREIRMRLAHIVSKNKKIPDLSKFYKLLSRHNIHKLEGDINNNYKVKLGLFVT